MSCNPTPTPTIITVHQHDVLFGRGGKNCKHAGNQRLRAVARSYKTTYGAATKKGKSDISRSIVSYFRSLDPPGRFLKKDDATGLWTEVKDDVAREKASQTLRDARDDPVPVDDSVGGGDRHGHVSDTYHSHHQSSGYAGDDDYYHHPPQAVTSSWEQPTPTHHHHHNHYEAHHHHFRPESWRHHPAVPPHHRHHHGIRDVRVPILDGRRAKVWIHGGGNRERRDSDEDTLYQNRSRIVLPLGGHCHTTAADAEVEAYVVGGGGPLSHQEGTVQVQSSGDGYEVNPSRKRRYHQAIQDDPENSVRSGGGPNRSSSSDYEDDNLAGGGGGNRMPHSHAHYYHTVTPPENAASAPPRYNDQTEDAGRFYDPSHANGSSIRPPSVPIEPSNSFEYAPTHPPSSHDEVRPSGGGNTVFAASTSSATSGNHHVAFPTPDSHCHASSSSAPGDWASKNDVVGGVGGGGGQWDAGYEYAAAHH